MQAILRHIVSFVSLYRAELAACGFLIAGTWVAFGHSLDNDFVNFDDDEYVTQNFDLHQGFSLEGVIWAFTETRRSAHWHPMTWISLAIDFDLWGLEPWGYHLTNLILHGANTLLLFLLLRWMTGAVWRSAMVAGLFAVHPLHVESVAWVTERKDVLSTFFWLLTTHAYLFFLERPQRDRYLLLLIAFALAILSKPMVVTLPFTLLLLDYWPLRRWGWSSSTAESEPGVPAAWGGPASWRRLLLEKTPLFAMVVFSCAMTYYGMSRGGVIKTFPGFSNADLLAHRLVMYVEYLRKMVWPSDLAAFYPMPAEPWPAHVVLLAGAFLGSVTVLCFCQARHRPYLLVGWFWYLGTLFPVNGIVQLASYAMADRYSYVSLTGIFVAGVWLASDVVPPRWRLYLLVPTAVSIFAVCVVLTGNQVKVWESGFSLWQHALAVTERNYMAHTGMAALLAMDERNDEALTHYRQAVAAFPENAKLNSNLGRFLLAHNRLEESELYLRKAVALDPNTGAYRILLSTVLARRGLLEESQKEAEEGDRLIRLQKR